MVGPPTEPPDSGTTPPREVIVATWLGCCPSSTMRSAGLGSSACAAGPSAALPSGVDSACTRLSTTSARSIVHSTHGSNTVSGKGPSPGSSQIAPRGPPVPPGGLMRRSTLSMSCISWKSCQRASLPATVTSPVGATEGVA